MSARQKRGCAGRLGAEFFKRASLGKMVDRTQTPTTKAKHVVTVEAGGLAKYFRLPTAPDEQPSQEWWRDEIADRAGRKE